MTGDQAANTAYLVLLVVLVGSALAVRQLPLGRTLKIAGAWVAIFAVVAVTASFRHDVADLLGSRLLGRAVASGGTVRIPMSEDGHFWVDARINGNPARLMVDSGATVTTLSQATAERTGVDMSGGLGTQVQTANGPMTVGRGRTRTIAVGGIQADDLAVHVAPGGQDINVLGMNFLSRLPRWSVEGRWLILTS